MIVYALTTTRSDEPRKIGGRGKGNFEMNRQEEEKLYATFHDTVLVPYTEYKTLRKERKAGRQADLNAARMAATAAYHFREHLPKRYKKSHPAMTALCTDFSLLGDVVNALKHGILTKGTPQIAGADDIREQIVHTIYRDEEGEYYDIKKSIEITLKDGTTRELFDVLTNVVNMWIDFLQAAGISGKATKFPVEDRNQIISRAAADMRMDLVITQGIAVEKGFKIQKYNYEKRLPEPVDLTGSRFSFSVYDPAKIKTEVAIQAISPEGKQYVGSVELDAEENREFFLLKDDVQPNARDAFIQKIMQRRGELVLHSEQTDLPGPDILIAKFNQSSDHEQKAKPEKPAGR